MNQVPVQNYQVQQQPILKPPILPPKASLGIANPTVNGSRAMLAENGNVIVLHKQQPPYIAPPYYENIEDVAASSMHISIISNLFLIKILNPSADSILNI